MLNRNQQGSVLVESIASIALLIGLGLSVVQVSLGMYARNVVADAAHEGARAALEIETRVEEATGVAAAAVREAAGALVSDLRVSASLTRRGDTSLVRVSVEGRIRPQGPLPLSFQVHEVATVTRQEHPR